MMGFPGGSEGKESALQADSLPSEPPGNPIILDDLSAILMSFLLCF